MKKMILILAIVIIALMCINVNAKETRTDYSVVTVVTVYDDIWEIEYDGNIYVYENLNFPKDTVYIIADVEGNYPKLIMDTEITNCTKNLKTFGDFVNRQ